MALQSTEPTTSFQEALNRALNQVLKNSTNLQYRAETVARTIAKLSHAEACRRRIEMAIRVGDFKTAEDEREYLTALLIGWEEFNGN